MCNTSAQSSSGRPCTVDVPHGIMCGHRVDQLQVDYAKDGHLLLRGSDEACALHEEPAHLAGAAGPCYPPVQVHHAISEMTRHALSHHVRHINICSTAIACQGC